MRIHIAAAEGQQGCGLQWQAATLSFSLHALLIVFAVWMAAPSIKHVASKPKVVKVSLLTKQIAPAAEIILPAPEPTPPPVPNPRLAPEKLQVPAEPKPDPRPVELPKPAEPAPIELTESIETVTAEPVAAGIVENEPEEALVEPNFQADYLRNPVPSYPRIAKRMGEQGEVLLRVLVDVQGKPREIKLHASSSFERLDKAALDVVQRWSFVPARRGSRAVEAWVIVPIIFSLR